MTYGSPYGRQHPTTRESSDEKIHLWFLEPSWGLNKRHRISSLWVNVDHIHPVLQLSEHYYLFEIKIETLPSESLLKIIFIEMKKNCTNWDFKHGMEESVSSPGKLTPILVSGHMQIWNQILQLPRIGA